MLTIFSVSYDSYIKSVLKSTFRNLTLFYDTHPFFFLSVDILYNKRIDALFLTFIHAAKNLRLTFKLVFGTITFFLETL